MAKLYDYQHAGVDYLETHKRVLLADDRGLGKSVQALRAATLPLLIVCKRSLMFKWELEIQKWTPSTWINGTVVCGEGTLVARAELLKAQPMIAIVNHDMLRADRKLPQLLTREWGTVILDEAHHFKGRNAKRTKGAFKLICDRLYLLTANGITNSPADLWALLRLLGGYAEFPSYWRWAERYCVIEDRRYGRTAFPIREITGWQNPRSVQRLLKDRYLRRTKSEIGIQLPDKTIVPIPLELTPPEEKAYARLETDLLYEAAENDWRLVGSALEKLIRLRQSLTTNILDPKLKTITKQHAVLELVQSILESESHTVVFTWFRKAAYDLAERIPRYCGKNTRVSVLTGETPVQTLRDEIDLFQTGTLKVPHVLIGTLGVLGEGHDLDRAAHAIFLERSYTPKDNSQAADRLHRLTQKRPVTIYVPWVRDTIDEAFNKLLSRKRIMINEVWMSSRVLQARAASR